MPDDSNDDAEFEQLMNDVRAGSQEAAWELIERFGPKIVKVVRRRLPEILRSKFDSQDFAQAAWASMFAHRSRLVEFGRADEFVAFMAGMVKNKVAMEVRRGQCQKRDISREKSLEDLGHVAQNQLTDKRGETPSQFAMAREKWFKLLAGQPPRRRRILELKFVGKSAQEIADELEMNVGSVRRILRDALEERGSD